MEMRLDKMLSNLGYGSRKQVKQLIRSGEVKVNETIIKKDDFHLDPDKDIVKVSDATVNYKPFVYIMLNKPQGVISATEDQVHTTVVDLIEGYDHYHVFPVGRLDKDTEGLLILTNDTIFSREMTFPSRHAAKKYYCELFNDLDESLIEQFKAGITIDGGYQCKPAILDIIEDKKAYITITEGKFHQIKRMFKAVGNEITFLKRLEMKGLKLDENLQPGAYRELTQEEYDLLEIAKLHESEKFAKQKGQKKS